MAAAVAAVTSNLSEMASNLDIPPFGGRKERTQRYDNMIIILLNASKMSDD
jgi:hypothetical protein